MRSKTLLVFSSILLLGNSGWSAIDLLSPTNAWNALPYSGVDIFSDYTEDTQATSADLDLVGYGSLYAVYTQFDQASTLGFRIRVAGDKNPTGFDGQLWIGADVNLDGNLDVFIGANSSQITLNYGGDGENTSPNNTTIDAQSPISITPVTSNNYRWTTVTTIDSLTSEELDIDGFLNPKSISGEDYFLTFSIDFNAFATAANELAEISGWTSASSIAYVVGTATQGNTLNSDLNGPQGETNSATSWTSLGAITPELSVYGAAIPEPATTTLFIAGLSFLFLIVRRRRS